MKVCLLSDYLEPGDFGIIEEITNNICKVRWLDGITSHHLASQLRKVSTLAFAHAAELLKVGNACK